MLKAVLIVDDEPDVCLLLSNILKKMNLASDYAQSLNKAQEKINQQTYEIFFLDLHLPDGVGFSLTDKIKEKKQDAKIIVISAYNGEEEQRKAQEKGVDYFIGKPFGKRMVKEALEQIGVL